MATTTNLSSLNPLNSTSSTTEESESRNITEHITCRCDSNVGIIVGGTVGATIFILIVVNVVIWYFVIKKKMFLAQFDGGTIDNSLLRQKRGGCPSVNIYDDVRQTTSSDIIETDSDVRDVEERIKNIPVPTRNSSISRKASTATGFKAFVLKKIPPGQKRAVTALAQAIPKRGDNNKKNVPTNIQTATESQIYQMVDESVAFQEDLYSDTMVAE